MEGSFSAISALTDDDPSMVYIMDAEALPPSPPPVVEDEHTITTTAATAGPAEPAAAQRQASTHSMWSAAVSSVFSFFPTPYMMDLSGRRVSILRKLVQDRQQRTRRQRLALCFCLQIVYLGACHAVLGREPRDRSCNRFD